MAALRHDVELDPRREPPVRPRRVPRRPPDAGVLRLGRSTTSACRRSCEALIEWAPPPQPRDGSSRIVQPGRGAVLRLRVQDPGEHGSEAPRPHRVLPRVLGPLPPGMKVRHLRSGREMKLANALTFMANERVASEDAVAGDIIGIHNHGQLQIGDTLTEGEALAFKGIPYFAPELFRVARPRDPFKAKQLAKGLQELGEEGAIQVFESTHGQHAAARRGRPAAVRDRRPPARDRVQGRRDLRPGDHLDRALAHLSRREHAPQLRARAGGVAGDRRRRQSGVPRHQQVQPAGDDGALAEGRLPRDARARASGWRTPERRSGGGAGFSRRSAIGTALRPARRRPDPRCGART